MNIVFLTQNDPFYLAENIDYLIQKMPSHSKVVGCVIFDVSPFGKKGTMFRKIMDTYKIFGFNFFVRFSIKFLKNKFDFNKNIKNILKRYNIPIIELKANVNSRMSLETISRYKPDLLISITANQIFKRPLIDLALKGCLNLHTALLPKYRGVLPSFWVLKNNEKHTGVSVFFIDEGIDSGPILVQKKVEIGDMTQEELIKCTKRIGMDAIIEAVELIEKGNYKLMENDGNQKTYFHFPARADVKEFLRKGKRFY